MNRPTQSLRLILLLLCASYASLGAETAFEEAFARGTANAYQGDYTAALEAFTQASEHGTSAALEANTAYSYWKKGELGRALLHYQRAYWLSPHDPDIAANRRQAAEAARLPVPPESQYVDFASILSVDAWLLWLACSFWGLIFALVLQPLLSRSRLLRVALASLFGLGVLASAAGLTYWFSQRNDGILLEAKTPLKAAPATKSPIKDNLLAGEQATLLSEHGDYFQIRTSQDETGWVSKDAFAPILSRKAL